MVHSMGGGLEVNTTLTWRSRSRRNVEQTGLDSDVGRFDRYRTDRHSSTYSSVGNRRYRMQYIFSLLATRIAWLLGVYSSSIRSFIYTVRLAGRQAGVTFGKAAIFVECMGRNF